jgi:hypothetical protein
VAEKKKNRKVEKITKLRKIANTASHQSKALEKGRKLAVQNASLHAQLVVAAKEVAASKKAAAEALAQSQKTPSAPYIA